MSVADYDPTAAPPRASLFSPTADRYGARLALVFGNHAPGGLCPYAAGGRCHHCDIGRGEGRSFDLEASSSRLSFFASHYGDCLDRVAHLVLYNSGSVLSRSEMPRELLGEILGFARTLPACRVVSLDSREPFVTREAVRFAAQAVGPARAVRPIIGLETADDHRRNRVLEKRMPAHAVRRAFEAIAAAGRDVGAARVGVDVNVLVGGPGTTAKDAVEDAVGTARWALGLARDAALSLDLNLHPYYPSARGLERFGAHPRCSLATLVEAIERVGALAREAGIFVGLEDAGHDREPAGWAPLERARAALERYNATQDRATLAGLHVPA